MKLQEVRDSALALPRRSREKLLIALSKSLTDASLPPPPGLLSEDDPNLESILAERVAAYERGETKAIPWEEVKERLYRGLNGNQISADSRAGAKRGKK